MDLRKIGIVYRKEVLESLRDRRTIISTVVIPIIIFPLIFVVFVGLASVMVKTAQSERSKIAIIGAEHAPQLAAKVRESRLFDVVNGEDFRGRISEKKLRATVEIPPDFGRLTGTNPPRATIYFH